MRFNQMTQNRFEPPTNKWRAVWPIAICALLAIAPQLLSADENSTFIEARGDKLFAGPQEFRFISFNVPNLHLVEDNFAFTAPTPWRWPNEFEITDALESVRQMGGTVVRSYVLSTYREDSNMRNHAFVMGPGEFNEEAYRILDKVLKIARQKGIRVIIPLIDNWHWQGGRAQYAGFRDKQPDDFWTDVQIMEDFEKTIEHTVNRVNSFTGIAYKEDPTILGWETGNELDPAPAWTSRIAAYIKCLDANHLVIDGCSLRGVQQNSLDDPNVDVITTHHYPDGRNNDFVPAIRRAWAQSKGKKPYVVGEFGFVPTENLARVLDFVIEEGISGALIWSLRFHNRDGGFYWHWEPAGGGVYKAYHWPGFDTGSVYDEKAVLQLMRTKAFEIRGIQPPPLEPPAPPRVLPIPDVGRITWQGSAGASAYDVQRATGETGPWQVVGRNVSDDRVQYRPLFNDATAQIGEAYYYRVIASSSAGSSDPSNIIGPVDCSYQVFVDDCADLSRVTDRSGPVAAVTGDDRRTMEDIHRLKLEPGASVVYHVAGPIADARVFVFVPDASANVELSWSADGHSFQPFDVARETHFTGSKDYQYAVPLLLSVNDGIGDARFLKIAVPDSASPEVGTIQLSQVEIRHGG